MRLARSRATGLLFVSGLFLAFSPVPTAGARVDEGGVSRSGSASTPDFVPAWLNRTYQDGTVVIRYPEGWKRGEVERFGTTFNDAESQHAAFVSLKYVPGSVAESGKEFGEFAARFLRPPVGLGTTVLYTQAARIGGRTGREAAVMWALRPDSSPLGPTMRVLGFELDSGETAIFVFAAERPQRHNADFAWIKKAVTWAQ